MWDFSNAIPPLTPQPSIFPSGTYPYPGGHPTFKAIADAVPQIAIPLTNFNRQPTLGYMWTLNALPNKVFLVRLWAKGFYERTAIANDHVVIGSLTPPPIPGYSPPQTAGWYGSFLPGYPPGTVPTYYVYEPISALTRGGVSTQTPPGNYYYHMNQVFERSFPNPNAGGGVDIVNPLRGDFLATTAVLGAWVGRVDCTTQMPAPLVGGFTEAFTGRTAGPVTLPHTIFVDIGNAP